MAGRERRPPKGQDSGFDGGDKPPRRSATGQIPSQRSVTGQVPVVGTAPKAKTGSFDANAVFGPEGSAAAGRALPVENAPGASPPVSGPMAMTDYQKRQLGSAFGDGASTRQRNTFFGTDPGRTKVLEDERPAAPATTFDGQTAPKELTSRDLFKAVVAPVQSRPGRRSKALYMQVLKQFAVGTNPRYIDDAPGRPRGHIFVWDVSRAMGCEVPHFVGAKELNLAQTCDWLRHEGPMRGWLRAGEMDTFEHVNAGHMVLAMPKDPRTKHLAVVFPQALNDEGVPELCGCGIERGWGLLGPAMFDVRQLEYFTHA